MKAVFPVSVTLVRVVSLAAFAVVVASCGNLRLPGQGGAKPPADTRVPAPIKTRSITLLGDCRQKEVDGFQEDAQVDVRANSVRSLSWKVQVGRTGSCAFDGRGFKQTRFEPNIELSARDGSGCKLMIWRDQRRITLAHAGCASFCSPASAHEKAWPVMFDPSSGGCANIDH